MRPRYSSWRFHTASFGIRGLLGLFQFELGLLHLFGQTGLNGAGIGGLGLLITALVFNFGSAEITAFQDGQQLAEFYAFAALNRNF